MKRMIKWWRGGVVVKRRTWREKKIKRFWARFVGIFGSIPALFHRQGPDKHLPWDDNRKETLAGGQFGIIVVMQWDITHWNRPAINVEWVWISNFYQMHKKGLAHLNIQIRMTEPIQFVNFKLKCLLNRFIVNQYYKTPVKSNQLHCILMISEHFRINLFFLLSQHDIK